MKEWASTDCKLDCNYRSNKKCSSSALSLSEKGRSVVTAWKTPTGPQCICEAGIHGSLNPPEILQASQKLCRWKQVSRDPRRIDTFIGMKNFPDVHESSVHSLVWAVPVIQCGCSNCWWLEYRQWEVEVLFQLSYAQTLWCVSGEVS